MNIKIDGRRYNTNSAQPIGSHEYEVLYKKKNFEFFIFNKIANSITPLSYDEACKWGKKYMPEKEYNKHLNTDIRLDDNDKTIINVSTTQTIINIAKRNASMLDMSFSDYISLLIIDANKANKKL